MLIIFHHHDGIITFLFQWLPFAFCCLWRSPFGHKFPIFSYRSPSYQGDDDDNDDDHDNDDDNDDDRDNDDDNDDDDDIIIKLSSFGHKFPILPNCLGSYQGDDYDDYDDSKCGKICQKIYIYDGIVLSY